MWWAGSESVHVCLGDRRVGWRIGGAPTQWFDATSWTDGLRSLTRALPKSLRSGAFRSKVAWHWKLTGRLAPAVTLHPPLGLSAGEEWWTWISAAAGQQAGMEGACTVWTSRGPMGSTTIKAAVVSDDVLREVHEVVRRAGGRVDSIRPWWTGAALQFKEPAVVAVLDFESLVLWSVGPSPDVALSFVPAPDDAMLEGFTRRALAEVGADSVDVRWVQMGHEEAEAACAFQTDDRMMLEALHA